VETGRFLQTENQRRNQMPMFEYTCSECNYRFEKFVQRWDAKMNCPLCDQPAEKQFSPFSVGASRPASGELPTGLPPKMCSNC
jgi:putative FmdB family regulatory protein